MDLLVIGDCSIDQYMDIEDSSVLHDPDTSENKICFLHGSKIVVHKFNVNLAGNSCHVGVAAAKLGLKVEIYTELGDDDYGDRFIKTFKENGIDISLCHQGTNAITNVHAIVWHAGDRTIFSYHEPRTYKLNFETLEKPKWIYYTSLAHGYESFQDTIIEYVEKNNDVGVAYNPGSIQMTNMGKVHQFLKITDVLFVNKEEAGKIIGVKSVEDIEYKELHLELQKLGVKMSVITDGKEGSSVYDGKSFVFKKPLLVDKVIDKTGAGDTYAATFLSALNYGKSIDTAMDWANKNSANVVKYIGALPGLLDLSELDS